MEIKKGIDWKAEFKDRVLEGEYYIGEMSAAMKFLRYIVLVFGIVYAAISLYDYGYNSDAGVFWRSTVSRLVVLAYAIVLFVVLRKQRSQRVSTLMVTLLELLAYASYIYLLYQQGAQGFMEQTGALMVLIMAVYLIPNRWIVSTVVCVAMAVSYLLISPLYIEEIPYYMYVEAMIYFVLAICLAGIAQYRLSLYKRRRYLEEKQLMEQSVTDALTGIHNRKQVDIELSWLCSRGGHFAAILFDIDDFKIINDTYGHLTGDQVLKEMSKTVSAMVRAGDMFARWGGEEFLILVPGFSEKQAAALSERLRKYVEQSAFADGRIRLTCSFGVTEYREGDTPERLMRRVDNSMYLSKSRGKNSVTISE